MLLFRKLLLTASRKTPDTKRACMPQAQLRPAKIAPATDGMIMIASVTGTGITATCLLILMDKTDTDTTATSTGTAVEGVAGTTVKKGVGREVSLAIAAAGTGQGHLL